MRTKKPKLKGHFQGSQLEILSHAKAFPYLVFAFDEKDNVSALMGAFSDIKAARAYQTQLPVRCTGSMVLTLAGER